jgi:alkaline phosphatase D
VFLLSGDPLSDSVILWTRYTPISPNVSVTIELRMAEVGTVNEVNLLNPTLNPQLRRASITVTEKTDFIAKIDVLGLKSNTKYVYAFSGKEMFIYPITTSI